MIEAMHRNRTAACSRNAVEKSRTTDLTDFPNLPYNQLETKLLQKKSAMDELYAETLLDLSDITGSESEHDSDAHWWPWPISQSLEMPPVEQLRSLNWPCDRGELRYGDSPKTPLRNQQKQSKVYLTAPLLLDTLSIRLFAFDRLPSGTIVGSLRNHDLEQVSHQWVALSYTWQSDDKNPHKERDYEIMVNEMPFYISENLWKALNRLMDKRTELRAGGPCPVVTADDRETPTVTDYDPTVHDWQHIWIDAICINQHDISERNHQVSLMKTIFSKARSVISWLTPVTALPAWSSQDIRSALMRRSSCDIGRSHEQAVLRNRYWQRMWIVQEMLLPTSIVFLYEGVWITFEWLKSVRDYAGLACNTLVADRLEYQQRRGNAISAPESQHRPSLDGPHSGHKANQSSSPMLALIKRYHSHRCTDVRDRVYALLALLPDDYPISADYSKSRMDIVLAVCEAEIQYLRSPAAMHHRLISSLGKDQASLLFGLPDWHDETSPHDQLLCSDLLYLCDALEVSHADLRAHELAASSESRFPICSALLKSETQ